LSRLLRQATGYVGASALAFGVDVALLTALVSGLGTPYLAAAAMSFLAGTVVVYWFSIRHVFDYRRVEDWRHEFAVFAALGALSLVINLAVMYALVTGLGVHYLVAKFGAAVCTFVANFLMRRWMLFTPRGATGRGPASDTGVRP